MLQISSDILYQNYNLFLYLIISLVFLLILSLIGWIILKLKKENASAQANPRIISFLILSRGIIWTFSSYIIIKIGINLDLIFLYIFGIATFILLGIGEIILSLGLLNNKEWSISIFNKLKSFILGPIAKNNFYFVNSNSQKLYNNNQ